MNTSRDAGRRSVLRFGVRALAGVLMVSNVLYYSFKDVDFKGKVPFLILAGIALLFGVISISPPLFLWLLFLVYAASGPVLWLWRKNRPRNAQ